MPSRLKSIRLPVSANLKLALVLVAVAIVTGTLLYTQGLVAEMKESERNILNYYIGVIQTYHNTETPDPQLGNLLFDVFTRIKSPMITTDEHKNPIGEITDDGRKRWTVRNIDYDTLASVEDQERELRARIASMQESYEPLVIYSIVTDTLDPRIVDSTVINYIYYDDSSLVERTRLLPIIEIIIGAMFIFVGYLSFSHIKRNEQSNIWVGMAKETAHQLGTPLSSLLGWIELLRLMPEDQDQVLEAASEMERDVERLNKVAQRFSKIGSAAEVKSVEINGVLRHVIHYFDRRLPNLGKKVTLSLDEADPVYVAINVDLFEWVFENLIRNAADAIDRPNGEIKLRVRQVRDVAVIDVSDNGRGIDPKIRKDIFRPGFSTKSRGWGLGLSLAKRIVEEYHGGKIAIKDSSAAGTTFRIRLAAVQPDGTPVGTLAPEVGEER